MVHRRPVDRLVFRRRLLARLNGGSGDSPGALQALGRALAETPLVIHCEAAEVAEAAVFSDTCDEIAVALFALAAMSIGYTIAALMSFDSDTRFTIGIEVGLQNVVLAVLISQVLMQRPEFSLFVLTYAMVIPLAMLPWVYIHRRRWSFSTLKRGLGLA